MSRDIAPFGVRMAAELKEKIEQASKNNGRSMNAEVIHRIELTFNPESGLGSVEKGEIPTPELARTMANEARASIERLARQHVIDQISKAVKRANTVLYLDFYEEFPDLEDGPGTEPGELNYNEFFNAVMDEFREMGYQVEPPDMNGVIALSF